MNYDEVIKNLQTLAEIPLNQEDENWARIIPLMFAYAEGRIYRDLDFLATTTITLGDTVARNREVDLPATILVLRQLSVICPSGLVEPEKSGVIKLRDARKVLERYSPEALDMVWPAETFRPGVPEKYAIIGKMMPQVMPHIMPVPTVPQVFSQVIRLAPTPDKAYPLEFLGVVRPDPISSRNPETYLSITYPDLLCAACMVFIAGYQRDYGAQADDPAKAMSWESAYQGLRASVALEATRMKGISTALVPAPGAL